MNFDNKLIQVYLNKKMKNTFKIIVEKNRNGYVAYPIGIDGIVVGQCDTYEDAISDVKSAIKFHIETFGEKVILSEPKIIEAFLTETEV